MLKRLFKKLTEDKGSWWIRKLHNTRLNCLRWYSGCMASLLAFLKGIEIKNGCRFFGVPHFHRNRFSSIQIGSNCTFRSDHTSNLIGVNHRCILSTHSPEAKIIIGNKCGFSGVSIGSAIEIRIGNNVICGANSIITDHDWHADRSNTVPKAVMIEDNVWIGVNTTVLKGVTIGKNSIIGANSLVVKDIPADVIAGGNPCRVLKKLNEQ